jgi:hypothetical protein
MRLAVPKKFNSGISQKNHLLGALSAIATE